MTWNWQQSDWPKFRWDATRLSHAEERFLLVAGVAIGTARHLGEDDRRQVLVELMSGEAVTTSALEGEVLSRASVQFSIQRQLGLATESRRVTPAEQGVAEMMVDLFRSHAEPLTEELLSRWHRMLTSGRRDLAHVGEYRTSDEPVQIVSGVVGAANVHFEAPPSRQVPAEMRQFLAWFERTGPEGTETLPAITRAGTAHSYFESIHPFEDGNGRIGRAIAEKALTQGFAQPVLTALAATILKHQKSYYEALERANRENKITSWLVWFAGIALEGQERSVRLVEFVLAKAKLLERLRGIPTNGSRRRCCGCSVRVRRDSEAD